MRHKEDRDQKGITCTSLLPSSSFKYFFFISNKSQDDTSLARFHAPLVIIACLYFQRATLAFTLSLSLTKFLPKPRREKNREIRKKERKKIFKKSLIQRIYTKITNSSKFHPIFLRFTHILPI